ncbi:MAG: undecaprenyl-diphosphatase UppP [Clostridiales bacterium]|mgnify:CR=1 FL=1|nr:undecaprenyl-diphosphatase UppP [Clostridiales bacterium]
MTLFEGIILGLIQGLAEFLPISSSGHLAIVQHFFGIEGESVLAFAVLLHLGTLISLVAVYYRLLWELILEFFAVIKDLITGNGLQINKNETRKLGLMIIAATIPTGLIGVLFNDFFSGLYNSIPAVAICLVLTGCFLWLAERMDQKGKNVKEMKFRDALFVGLCQGIAIIPGISRSGATIVGSLFSGLNRELAVRFAFLISIPAILGAVVLEAPAAFEEGMAAEILLPVVAGVVVAAISGYIAIKTMIRVVSNKKLYIFSFYTWIVGGLVLLYTFMNLR